MSYLQPIFKVLTPIEAEISLKKALLTEKMPKIIKSSVREQKTNSCQIKSNIPLSPSSISNYESTYASLIHIYS